MQLISPKRLDMTGRGRELYKKLKFDHTNQWYMHNPESIIENETHKLLWDFEIQTYHPISARWPDRVIVIKEKRTCRILNLAVTTNQVPTSILKSEERDKYVDLAWEQKKIWSMKVTVIPIIFGALGMILQRSGKGTGSRRNQRTRRDHPDNSFIKIG